MEGQERAGGGRKGMRMETGDDQNGNGSLLGRLQVRPEAERSGPDGDGDRTLAGNPKLLLFY